MRRAGPETLLRGPETFNERKTFETIVIDETAC